MSYLIERDRETETETGRQRQRDRHRERETETERQTGSQTDREEVFFTPNQPGRREKIAHSLERKREGGRGWVGGGV